MVNLMNVLTRDQVRRIDSIAIHEWGIPGLLLMENAGRGVADVMCSLGIDGPVVVACAKGNNGGDGFVLARHLSLRGYEVNVLLCCGPEELQSDAAANYQFLQKTHVPITQFLNTSPTEFFQHADWLVDALLGTGARGDPRDPLQNVITEMNARSSRRLAMDIPSGLDCDTGEVGTPTFLADHTCTFVAAKPGLLMTGALPYVGQLHVLDIGVAVEDMRP